MIERDMEDLIEAFPDDFFPDKGFVFKERQTSFAGVGRFDLLFEDRYKRTVLMELKAVPAKSDAVDQLIRYQEELERRGQKNLVLWLVAPHISRPLRDLLDRFGIEYKEIHEGEYRYVAGRHEFSIRSERPQTGSESPQDNVLKVSVPGKSASGAPAFKKSRFDAFIIGVVNPHAEPPVWRGKRGEAFGIIRRSTRELTVGEWLSMVAGTPSLTKVDFSFLRFYEKAGLIKLVPPVVDAMLPSRKAIGSAPK